MENKKPVRKILPHLTSTKNMNFAQAPLKKKCNGIILERRHRLNEKYEK